ncbi:MAG: hypothetical protein U0271_36325 [Polyangiaceae bacterium]
MLGSLRLASLLLLTGCSLAFPLDGYDEGTGASAAGGAGGTQTTNSTNSSGPSGGAGGTGGGPGVCGSGLYPPASTFTDSFDENETPQFLGCGVQTGGELVFDMPTTPPHFCASEAPYPLCLVNSAFTVKVPQAATVQIPGVQTTIHFVAADSSGEMLLLLEGNGFALFGTAGGQDFDIPIPNGSYDPFAAAWWRLEGVDGQLSFQTSSNGTDWVERVRADVPLSLDGLTVELGANRYYNDAFPQSADLPATSAHFDCVNLAGNCP